MHITLRATSGVPNLRAQLVFNIVARSIEAAVRRGHRIVHFSVQHNHVHLIVESDEEASIGRRMQRFASRLAQLVNFVVGRRGRFWVDRYHRRDITSPRQMKNTYGYVLFNARKHAGQDARDIVFYAVTPDHCSSVRWFTDWDPRARPPPPDRPLGERPVAAPRTWLARTGWKRHGLLRFDATPCMAGGS